MPFADHLVATWYAPKPTLLARALWPLSLVFRALVAFRRALYRVGLLRAHALRVPVIVVGNLTVGGAGKTPLALALASALAERGHHPGIVSRGYGGSNVMPRAVAPGDDPHVVGDEPLLYAKGALPIWIGRRRSAAAQALAEAHPNVDVVIADDGLQHYALARTMEIIVVDAAREVGNGMLLPAGPLREPATRLLEADAVVRLVSRDDAYPAPAGAPSTRMWLETLPWRNLAQAELAPTFDAWEPGTVHAVAGIAHPERFFALLQKLGLEAH